MSNIYIICDLYTTCVPSTLSALYTLCDINTLYTLHAPRVFLYICSVLSVWSRYSMCSMDSVYSMFTYSIHTYSIHALYTLHPLYDIIPYPLYILLDILRLLCILLLCILYSHYILKLSALRLKPTPAGACMRTGHARGTHACKQGRRSWTPRLPDAAEPPAGGAPDLAETSRAQCNIRARVQRESNAPKASTQD